MQKVECNNLVKLSLNWAILNSEVQKFFSAIPFLDGGVHPFSIVLYSISLSSKERPLRGHDIRQTIGGGKYSRSKFMLFKIHGHGIILGRRTFPGFRVSKKYLAKNGLK